MYQRRLPPAAAAAAQGAEGTTCGTMLVELETLWNEIGESDIERDKMIRQLELECLNVYRKKVDLTRKQKADLHQALAEAEVAASTIISALGECETFSLVEKSKGTLKEQVAAIKPTLDALSLKKEERLKEFRNVQSQISQICAEVSGSIHCGVVAGPQVDERDLTLKKLEEMKAQLQDLQKDKNNRLQKVNSSLELIRELSIVMSIDFSKMVAEVHPCFGKSLTDQPMSINNDTIARLAGTIHSLNHEKEQRLKKLQHLGSTLIELWNLMGTSLEEQKTFDHVTSLISVSTNAVLGPGSLAIGVIEETEAEVERLNILKVSKAKELVMKKQSQLEEIYQSVHIDVDSDATRIMLVNLIESGRVDLVELLSRMDDQIAKAKEEALSRKDILDKVEKWKFACEEENWLDDYEKDQNRYSAGRGAHKNLKRAEKARILVSKLQSMIDNLITKVKVWENEKGMPFKYEKMRLLDILEEYVVSKQQREEEKRRSREQKKIQEQLTAEQEALFGTKPTPARQFSARKPLGQSANANVTIGTPNSRRVSTPLARPANSSFNKERREKAFPVTPINYVALPKDDPLPTNSSSPAI